MNTNNRARFDEVVFKPDEVRNLLIKAFRAGCEWQRNASGFVDTAEDAAAEVDDLIEAELATVTAPDARRKPAARVGFVQHVSEPVPEGTCGNCNAEGYTAENGCLGCGMGTPEHLATDGES